MNHSAVLRGLIMPAAFLSCVLNAPLTVAFGADLGEPFALASKNGVLDILMVARAAPITTFPSFNATGWVYDICERPKHGADACPATTENLYAGVRLQLSQGDLLKIRLVNCLPPILDSDHATEPGHAFLALNPINVHTHGMLVSPHFPTPSNPTYGDNVFVMTLNPDNGPMPEGSHAHSDVRFGHTDYTIPIPGGHPSGLFWFHPHVHGIALN